VRITQNYIATRRRECRLDSGHQSFVAICGNNRRPDPFLKQALQVRNSPKVIKLALLIHEADSNCETLIQPINSEYVKHWHAEFVRLIEDDGVRDTAPDLFIIRLFSGSIIGSPTYRMSAMNSFSIHTQKNVSLHSPSTMSTSRSRPRAGI
jgi:hypothetical protein